MSDKKDSVARRGHRKIVSYQSVFESPLGKQVLIDLMKTHHVMKSTYTNDQNEALINEGERRVILRILEILKQNPNTLMERIVAHEEQME